MQSLWQYHDLASSSALRLQCRSRWSGPSVWIWYQDRYPFEAYLSSLFYAGFDPPKSILSCGHCSSRDSWSNGPYGRLQMDEWPYPSMLSVQIPTSNDLERWSVHLGVDALKKTGVILNQTWVSGYEQQDGLGFAACWPQQCLCLVAGYFPNCAQGCAQDRVLHQCLHCCNSGKKSENRPFACPFPLNA